jgi:hypothetical protein
MAENDWRPWEVAEDVEQILAAEADGFFDLTSATVQWLLDTLDWLAEPEARVPAEAP